MTTETKRICLEHGDFTERPACPDCLIEAEVARREMLSLLREVEWSADLYADAGNEVCPVCFGAQPDSDAADPDTRDDFPLVDGTPRPAGHKPDCRLAAFLKET